MFKKWGILCTISLLVLTACSNKGEGQEETKEPIEEPVNPENELVEEKIELPYIAPFTGVGSEEEIKQRPIIVTMNNHPLARPQSGIGQADIVYEMVAEGNVTRFLALYQSEIPETIGPVRSARDYFVNLAKGLDAFYIAHGYSPDAQKMLNARVVDNINGMQYDGILFKRSKDRKAPHNSYISKENIFAGAEKVGASMEMNKIPSLSFYDSIEGAKIGNPASSVSIRYGSGASFENQYTYIPEEGLYERKSAGVLTTDKETEEPVKISNVIFMEIPHKIIDNAGRQDLTLTGSGKAYLFQAGVMRVIDWENVDGVLIPMENGVPAKLVKGKSWVSFVPTNPGLESMVNFLP
ncbi:DUF3048 domain-containing protein [Psychrobacillus vulpis]|uniref:DUF3048 domain-containing protein n=1 Tax=Psychrobacillus vulpis TaxID=2325572 RepID=A0A544TJP6_9BACI|nr:DUF3048 domain-containing protein [Psychrobacillus vulpis]TQR17685.1 DUF3048 domain-containing protein [Psychrobacillus vulpis]